VNRRSKQVPFALICFGKWELKFLLQDIDIAHRVSTRRERNGPKPVICKFVRRLAKGKVMEVRKRAAEVNPTRNRVIQANRSESLQCSG